METLFKEPDYDVVQCLFGFTLIAAALLLSTVLAGNVYALTGFIALLLLKDGIPNFIIGAMKLGQKKPEGKKG